MNIKPNEGESYESFVARCVPAILQLGVIADETYAKDMVETAWREYIMECAVEATVIMKRDHKDDSIYNDPWCSPWYIAEIVSAQMPTITYSSVEKATAASGEEFTIAKSVKEKQLVFGWANIAKDKNGNFPLDWDGDVTSPDQLENAAYSFVLKHRKTGERHQGDAVGNMVESVMFTKEKMDAMGIPPGIVPEGWWVGFHIPDAEVFAKVKSGEYEMLSVQGKAKRTPTGI
ncbi:hypothetical protein D3C76_169760 [compost metagenome]